jgi:hypothetical protein
LNRAPLLYLMHTKHSSGDDRIARTPSSSGISRRREATMHVGNR